MKQLSSMIIMMLFMFPDVHAATGNTCYATVRGVVYFSKLKRPQNIGERCIVYSQTFNPVYEGRVSQ